MSIRTAVLLGTVRSAFLYERHRVRSHLPWVSRDWGGIFFRNFYIDGTQSNLDRNLGVCTELARGYRTKLPASNL
jgi:hypothetical protein